MYTHRKIDCVDNVLVDNSNCLKSCSGLVVTSYSESRKDENNVKSGFPVMAAYNRYKKVTTYPSGHNGNIR